MCKARWNAAGWKCWRVRCLVKVIWVHMCTLTDRKKEEKKNKSCMALDRVREYRMKWLKPKRTLLNAWSDDGKSLFIFFPLLHSTLPFFALSQFPSKRSITNDFPCTNEKRIRENGIVVLYLMCYLLLKIDSKNFIFPWFENNWTDCAHCTIDSVSVSFVWNIKGSYYLEIL